MSELWETLLLVIKVLGTVVTTGSVIVVTCWRFGKWLTELFHKQLEPIHQKLDRHHASNGEAHRDLHDRVTNHAQLMDDRMDRVEQIQAVHADRLASHTSRLDSIQRYANEHSRS